MPEVDRPVHLRDVPDAHAAGPVHLAGVGLLLADEDLQERGLAAPVRADETYAGPFGDLKGDVGEQIEVPVGDGEFRGCEERHGVS